VIAVSVVLVLLSALAMRTAARSVDES